MFQLIKGFFYLLRGLGLLNQPSLRRFVVVPLAVNVLLFGSGVYLLTQYFSEWMEKWLGMIPGWLSWLEWLIWPIFALAVVLVVFYTFGIVANIIASPFNALLAEAVERHLGGEPLPDSGGLLKALVSAPAAIFDELRKLGYFLVRALPLLLLFFIPVINIIAAPLWLLFSGWMAAVEYGDYPMGNNQLLFAEQRERLRQRRWLHLGFGTSVALAQMIPLVNFLVMPAAVCSATLIWFERTKG